jgi:F0F1-type ATP synthase assembly protein I
MYIVMKILVSAIVIGVVTEVARRFPSYGGIVAALPLVSLLSIIWLYFQGEQNTTLSKFALGVLWGFPATALLLLIVYLSLKHSIPLFISIGFGIGGWLIFLHVQEVILKYFHISIFK